MTRTPQGEPEDPIPHPLEGGSGLVADWVARLGLARWAARLRGPHRRLLFLDDDPNRARRFLMDHPRAIWVTNVPDCIDKLADRWDEVHLDHDLGGEAFVDSSGADCGMEVIRWLCKEPRPHLENVSFFVHTHNETAGVLMVLLMRGRGYRAEFRPFGRDLRRLLAHNERNRQPEMKASLGRSPSIGPGFTRLPIRRFLPDRLLSRVREAFGIAFKRSRGTHSAVAGPQESGKGLAPPDTRRDPGPAPVPSTPTAAGPCLPIAVQESISETAAVIQPPPRTISS